jgi:DNA-binding response OmpR family regulator
MPGMNGIELARRVHARDPELPVLLASGYSEEIVGAAGADFEIVRKPYDVGLLEAAVSAALERAPSAP